MDKIREFIKGIKRGRAIKYHDKLKGTYPSKIEFKDVDTARILGFNLAYRPNSVFKVTKLRKSQIGVVAEYMGHCVSSYKEFCTKEYQFLIVTQKKDPVYTLIKKDHRILLAAPKNGWEDHTKAKAFLQTWATKHKLGLPERIV